MIAIMTRYLGPTNHRGSRVAATTCTGHRHVMSWDDSKDINANHLDAAKELCSKMGWDGDSLVGGATAEGYAFVFVGKQAGK